MSVCLSAGSTVRPTDLKVSPHVKDHHISNEFEDHSLKSKVKNVKVSVFSLVSEKVVQGQCRRFMLKVIGQGHMPRPMLQVHCRRLQELRSKDKVTWSRSKVLVGISYPHPVAGGAAQGRFHYIYT